MKKSLFAFTLVALSPFPPIVVQSYFKYWLNAKYERFK